MKYVGKLGQYMYNFEIVHKCTVRYISWAVFGKGPYDINAKD